MIILALGDPHGKLPKNLDGIIKKNKVDLIVCVGDFAFTPEKPWIKESWKGVKQSHLKKTYEDVVDKICSYSLPVLTLRGNMFQTGKYKKQADKILRNQKNLVNKFVGNKKILDQNFVFFDVIYEKHSSKQKNSFSLQSMKSNKSKQRRLNKLLKENPNSILITHNPPYGYVDKAYNGKHVGSKIILQAIKKHQPKLVLCGHIHEAKGEAKIGKTKVYNLGCCGDYKILEI